MNKILAAFLLSALISSAAADELYKVEFIVFENLDPAAQFSEQWPENPGQPAAENNIELSAQTTPLNASAAPSPGENPWRQLTAAELSMGGVYQRLRASARYRPVLHMGWVQPLDNSDHTLGVHVRGDAMSAVNPASAMLANSPSTVDGTVALRRGRFLHTDVDLVYSKAATPAENASVNPPLQVRMTDSRRLRNNELHYLDHPLFGVIITVNPVESNAASGAQ